MNEGIYSCARQGIAKAIVLMTTKRNYNMHLAAACKRAEMGNGKWGFCESGHGLGIHQTTGVHCCYCLSLGPLISQTESFLSVQSTFCQCIRRAMLELKARQVFQARETTVGSRKKVTSFLRCGVAAVHLHILWSHLLAARPSNCWLSAGSSVQ